MSRGMYWEAKGAADLALADAKPGLEDSIALMVRVVANILIDRPEQALKDLANPVIGANYDSQLWKALAYARQGKWAEAREKFKNVEFAITSLPIELQRIVISEAMRASLEVRDYSGAAKRGSDLKVVGVPAGDESGDGGAARPAGRSARSRQGRAERIQGRDRTRRTAPRRPKPGCSISCCGSGATRSTRPTPCANSRRLR